MRWSHKGIYYQVKELLSSILELDNAVCNIFEYPI